MKAFVLLLAACLSCTAGAATLVSTFKHPTAPGGGPKSLVAVRVYYGTCNNNQFGTWEGGKTLPMPLTRMEFAGLPYRRTCTQAFWQRKSGQWMGPSPVSIAEAK